MNFQAIDSIFQPFWALKMEVKKSMYLGHQPVTSESVSCLFCPRITTGAEHLTMNFGLEYLIILNHLGISIWIGQIVYFMLFYEFMPNNLHPKRLEWPSNNCSTFIREVIFSKADVWFSLDFFLKDVNHHIPHLRWY